MAADNLFGQSPVPTLPAEASPAVIRDGLVDAERDEFDQAWAAALARAAQTLDLAPVLEVLRTYHRITWLTARHGRQAHERMLDNAAAIHLTGGNPQGVDADEVRALIRSRLGP